MNEIKIIKNINPLDINQANNCLITTHTDGVKLSTLHIRHGQVILYNDLLRQFKNLVSSNKLILFDTFIGGEINNDSVFPFEEFYNILIKKFPNLLFTTRKLNIGVLKKLRSLIADDERSRTYSPIAPNFHSKKIKKKYSPNELSAIGKELSKSKLFTVDPSCTEDMLYLLSKGKNVIVRWRGEEFNHSPEPSKSIDFVINQFRAKTKRKEKLGTLYFQTSKPHNITNYLENK